MKNSKFIDVYLNIIKEEKRKPLRTAKRIIKEDEDNTYTYENVEKALSNIFVTSDAVDNVELGGLDTFAEIFLNEGGGFEWACNKYGKTPSDEKLVKILQEYVKNCKDELDEALENSDEKPEDDEEWFENHDLLSDAIWIHDYLKNGGEINFSSDVNTEDVEDTSAAEGNEEKVVCFRTSDPNLIDAINSGFDEVVFFVKAKDEATGEDTVQEVKFGPESFSGLEVKEAGAEEGTCDTCGQEPCQCEGGDGAAMEDNLNVEDTGDIDPSEWLEDGVCVKCGNPECDGSCKCKKCGSQNCIGDCEGKDKETIDETSGGGGDPDGSDEGNGR